ncbi:hypothetical protein DDB_G0269870 [Dictyostelium discoideum AX4]|uniref:C2H2-type domain-containing protein n=1 Tax=Dictyostelium discoideum TaxID=44689 RepID=Q55CW8_DICDI|nr:hypothetical protein DDB_G0269870 [Dictyostelium discoideum AX4]EAL72285.1 hypothetical protein DDB_G0269870 [Dictyostelium discoideum AX4]|eukprot:XP_646363.1 hypothetical protein DDB_G0269870 [Dictyostelium discoideum AX4]
MKFIRIKFQSNNGSFKSIIFYFSSYPSDLSIDPIIGRILDLSNNNNNQNNNNNIIEFEESLINSVYQSLFQFVQKPSISCVNCGAYETQYPRLKISSIFNTIKSSFQSTDNKHYCGYLKCNSSFDDVDRLSLHMVKEHPCDETPPGSKFFIIRGGSNN